LARDRHQFLSQQPLDIPSRDELGNGHPLERAEQLERLRRLLATLPEREQLAIHTFFLNEKSAQQSAELLEISRSGLYALLGRALARLASLMKSEGSQKESQR
jgi:RNA polymerase sigma factor (sigma-70 family)